MVPGGAYLADVGSDHAYLPISLIKEGKISYAQAIDNKMAPFLRMKRNVEDSGLSAHIACSFSSGLDELQPDVDTLAICGVGGLLTCEILEKHQEKLDQIKTIILDPHRDLQAVRKRVAALGYHLVDEEMLYEGKIYYTIMKWEKGKPAKPYTQEELLFGPFVIKKKGQTFHDYLEIQLDKVNGILDGPLPKEKREPYLKLYRQIKKQLARYE
jgi:tRNA (adenine22-N1)-methyltransferase